MIRGPGTDAQAAGKTRRTASPQTRIWGQTTLLGQADRVLGLTRRLAECFVDTRLADRVEHSVATLVGQRVFGLALGYEDLNDHDQLRHDPVFAILAGKLASRRQGCAAVAGKSTLNRLELSKAKATRYHKISHDPGQVEALFVKLFLEAHARPPEEIVLDLDATDDPLHGEQEGRFFHGYYDSYCYLPLYIFCGRPTRMPAPGRWRKWPVSSGISVPAGRRRASCCGPIPALPARR